MQAQQYWNSIGSKKEFEDPLYLDKLSDYLHNESTIIEYGCGYGRLMNILKSAGYTNLRGFDYAESMVERGRSTYPGLDMHVIKSGQIPCADKSVDAVIMLTVLCCIVDDAEQARLMAEIHRVLKPKGILYLSDFLICSHSRYAERYAEGLRVSGVRGIYTTAENLTVRHLTTKAALNLLNDFDVQWFQQFDFKTMNQNPARTFHCIAQKNGQGAA